MKMCGLRYKYYLWSGIFVLVNLINVVCGGNILYVNPIPIKSNHDWHAILATALAKRGHNVTFVTHFPMTENISSLHVIMLKDVVATKYELVISTDTDLLTTIKSITNLWNWGLEITQSFLSKSEIRALLDLPKDFFDLIIYNYSLGFIEPLLDKFLAPVIGASPCPYFLHTYYAMGVEWFTSYMPVMFQPSTNYMSLIERTKNWILYNTQKFYRMWLISSDSYSKIIEQYIGKHRSVLEIENNFTLLLVNRDPLLNSAISLPPNVIEVGGMHLQPANKLEGRLKAILDNSIEGVILFSMGSHFKMDQLNKMWPHILKDTIEALGRLKQIVLWKSDIEIDGLPKNIVVKKWLPQGDILAHPNFRLFITHGGSLSTQEAMYHGVPCIVIPTLADQFNNAANIDEMGIGKKLFIENLKEDTLYNAINEVLNNPTYRKNMALLSKKYRDRPQTALEKSIYWVEYILKYGAAKEYELATRRMNFIKTYNFDVLFLIFAVLIVINFLGIKIVKKILHLRNDVLKTKRKMQ